MSKQLIQFIALFLTMLVTGIFWGTWFSLSRSMEVFSLEEFIHIGKAIIANLALPMRLIMPSCILFIGLFVWIYPVKNSPGFYFSIAAIFFMVISLLITLLIEVPIDNQIKLWAANKAPFDWEEIRNRWEIFHMIRTFSSLASFGSLTASIIFIQNQKLK